MTGTSSVILQEDIVKLQTVNLAAKLCIANPKQTKLLCQYVLNLAKYDQNYDIRDRARFLRQLVLPEEVSLSGCVSFCTCRTVSLSILLPVSLSACLSVCLSACLSVCLSACLPVYLSLLWSWFWPSFMCISMTAN